MALRAGKLFMFARRFCSRLRKDGLHIFAACILQVLVLVQYSYFITLRKSETYNETIKGKFHHITVRLTSYVPLGSVITSALHLPLGLDFHLY